jgi:hypothetical protein
MQLAASVHLLTTFTYGWVESIGVANENVVFAALVGLAKRFEA